MPGRASKLAAATTIATALAVAACKTNGTAPGSAGPVGTATPAGAASGTPATVGGSSIPALVSVNLQNVLNDLSVAIKVDRANIPVNAQVPIDVAANVCGVSVSALAASAANGMAHCTAKTSSPQLAQSVQQQISAGGNVGGGAQSMGGTTTNNMF